MLISHFEWWLIADSFDLTSRQFEIIKHIVDGYDDFDTSKKLGVTVHTVHAHKKKLYQKLDVHNSAELVSRVFFSYLVDHVPDHLIAGL